VLLAAEGEGRNTAATVAQLQSIMAADVELSGPRPDLRGQSSG
jgi:hypothetical protein